jgi:hypothetical protein
MLQVSVAQRAAPVSNLGRRHVAFRQKVAAQAVGDLAGINALVLLFCCRDLSNSPRVAEIWPSR